MFVNFLESLYKLSFIKINRKEKNNLTKYFLELIIH